MKQIHNLVLTRSHAKEAFGFRIIGGKEQGLTFKVRRLGMILEKSIAKIFGHPIVSFVRQMAKYRKYCFILHCLNSGCACGLWEVGTALRLRAPLPPPMVIAIRNQPSLAAVFALP